MEGIIKALKLSKSKKITLLVVAIILIIFVIFCIWYILGSKKLVANNEEPYLPKVSERAGQTGDATNGASTTDTGTSTTIDTKIENGGITITSPVTGTSIDPGSTVVTGTVSASVAGDLYYMIKGATTGVLIDTKVRSVSAGASEENYSFTISFDNLPKGSDSAVLEVYLMNGSTKAGYADIGVRI